MNGPDYHASVTDLHVKQKQEKIDACARAGNHCIVCPPEKAAGCEYHPAHREIVDQELKNYEG